MKVNGPVARALHYHFSGMYVRSTEFTRMIYTCTAVGKFDACQ